jgi:hypothetical protein
MVVIKASFGTFEDKIYDKDKEFSKTEILDFLENIVLKMFLRRYYLYIHLIFEYNDKKVHYMHSHFCPWRINECYSKTAISVVYTMTTNDMIGDKGHRNNYFEIKIII